MMQADIILQKEGALHMANLLTMILIALIGVVGGIPTLAITIIIPIVIVWKIIRKIHYGYSLYR